MLERILGRRIRRIVECKMKEQGFRRGMADGMFTLRQLEGQENTALRCIDLEKAKKTQF